MEVLILSEKETQDLGIDWKEAIETVEGVFKAHGLGRVVVPTKVSLDMNITGEFQGGGNAMPAYLDHMKIAGMKWITWNWSNREYGLPSVMATLILNDPKTGAPLAIMGAAWITAVRTGAVTAMAHKYLGKNSSSVLAVIGAGVQSRFQIDAMKQTMKIQELRIYDVRQDVAKKLADDAGIKWNLNAKACATPRETVEEADAVITVTTANEPLVKSEWLKEKGVVLYALGSYQEYDYSSIRKCGKIVVDHLDQTMHRGELAKWVQKGVLRERDIYCELGQIVAGKLPGRENDDENIFCVPIGMGCVDIGIAYGLWQVAKKKGVGTRINWI